MVNAIGILAGNTESQNGRPMLSKTDLYCLSTDVFFAPVLSDSHTGAGTEMSAAKAATKGKWLISWESIISISMPENNEYGRLTKTAYP